MPTRKRPRRTSYRKWKVVAVLSAIALLIIFVPPVRSGISEISLKILSLPVIASERLFGYFATKGALMRENSALNKKVADLSLELELAKDLKSENERLRALLDFKKEFGFDTISAEVIARNPNDWLGSFVIDKGSAQGVRQNAAVCSSKGLLGKVYKPGDNASTVMLVTHPGFRAGGLVRGTRVNAVVAGTGKDTVKLLYIPLDADVKPGETVVTSGYSRTFPKGIVIGRIISVVKNPTGLYKEAQVRPIANTFDQEEVLCLK